LTPSSPTAVGEGTWTTAFINWINMHWYYYLVAGGGLVTILSVMFYFAAGKRASSPGVKIPAVIGGTVGGLAAGLGVGIVIMVGFGYRWEPQKGPPPGMPGGPPGMPGGKGGPEPPGGFPFPGMKETPKSRLAALVETLDRLTGKPLHLTLAEKEKVEVRKQLRGLDGKELSLDEAVKRVNQLQEALKAHQKILIAAGYTWQEEGTPPAAQPPEDPLQDPRIQAHLQALKARLEKGVDE
jgi:hypothetical protein